LELLEKGSEIDILNTQNPIALSRGVSK